MKTTNRKVRLLTTVLIAAAAVSAAAQADETSDLDQLKAAMQTMQKNMEKMQRKIDELEKEKRGLYAGAVGYFSAGGEMDTCIVLRTALIKDGTMYVQAGAGIVADSDPAFEQQECINKAKALFRAADEARRFASAAKRGQ